MSSIFTSTTEATWLKQNKGWLKGLRERAELVHGIATNSDNTKKPEVMIQKILAGNYL
jgi:hypothetical protein